MINEKIYNLIRTGQTRYEDGNRIEVSNKQMAEMKLDAKKKSLKKRPHLIPNLVVIRHKIKVTPYGCSVIDVVPSSDAIILCDKKPHEWERMVIAPEPVGMEPQTEPVGMEPQTEPVVKPRKKAEGNGDV